MRRCPSLIVWVCVLGATPPNVTSDFDNPIEIGKTFVVRPTAQITIEVGAVLESVPLAPTIFMTAVPEQVLGGFTSIEVVSTAVNVSVARFQRDSERAILGYRNRVGTFLIFRYVVAPRHCRKSLRSTSRQQA